MHEGSAWWAAAYQKYFRIDSLLNDDEQELGIVVGADKLAGFLELGQLVFAAQLQLAIADTIAANQINKEENMKSDV